MTGSKKLQLRLFGPFSARWSSGEAIDIKGAKARALLAILATAPDGKQTRAFLEATLWSQVAQDMANSSLRLGLANLRSSIGSSDLGLLSSDRQEVILDPNQVEILGSTTDGRFLEGLDINEEPFEEWLADMRRSFAAKSARRIQNLLRYPDAASVTAVGLAATVEDWISAYLNVSQSNILPDELEVLYILPAALRAISVAVYDTSAVKRAAALEQKVLELEAEVQRLTEALLEAKKEPQNSLFWSHVQSQSGKSVGDWKMWAALVGGCWALLGDGAVLEAIVELADQIGYQASQKPPSSNP